MKPSYLLEMEMTADQIDGSNLAYKAIGKKGGNFILADGPGMGKTLQIIQCLLKAVEENGKPNLIVAPNRNLEEHFTKVLSGIKSKERNLIQTCHFGDLDRKLKGSNFNIVAVDEAHLLGRGNNKKTLKALRKSKAKKMLSTANAFSEPVTACLMVEMVTGKSEKEVLSDFELIKEKDGYHPVKCWRSSLKKIAQTKKSLTKNKLMAQRCLPFYGMSQWEDSPSKDSERMEGLLQRAEKEIENGNFVVIYSEKEGLAKAIKSRKGIIMQVDVDGFKSGKGNLTLLCPKNQAEGIRLHDKKGGEPRTLLIDGPYTPDVLIQMEGRIHRRNSRSEPNIIAFFDPESPKENKKMSKMLAALEVLEILGEPIPALAREKFVKKKKKERQEGKDLSVEPMGVAVEKTLSHLEPNPRLEIV